MRPERSEARAHRPDGFHAHRCVSRRRGSDRGEPPECSADRRTGARCETRQGIAVQSEPDERRPVGRGPFRSRSARRQLDAPNSTGDAHRREIAVCSCYVDRAAPGGVGRRQPGQRLAQGRDRREIAVQAQGPSNRRSPRPTGDTSVAATCRGATLQFDEGAEVQIDSVFEVLHRAGARHLAGHRKAVSSPTASR